MFLRKSVQAAVFHKFPKYAGCPSHSPSGAFSRKYVLPTAVDQVKIAVAQDKLKKAFAKLLEYHKGEEARRRDSLQSEDENDALQQAQMEWTWITNETRSHARSTSSASNRPEGADEEKIFATKIIELIDRRVEQHEPIAYILGTQPFGPLLLQCKPPVLIPRPETEFLTEHVARLMLPLLEARLSAFRQGREVKPFRVLDLCTGSGCMALLLRHRLAEFFRQADIGPGLSSKALATITAVDIADEAIALTKANADFCKNNKLQPFMDQIMLNIERADVMLDADMKDVSERFGPFDVIVCNPPYIHEEDWKRLDPCVRLWEDRRALIGANSAFKEKGGKDVDGLAFFHRLSRLLSDPRCLRKKDGEQDDAKLRPKSALVAIEVGYDQAPLVAEILRGQARNHEVAVWTDPFGVERGVVMRKLGKSSLKSSTNKNVI